MFLRNYIHSTYTLLQRIKIQTESIKKCNFVTTIHYLKMLLYIDTFERVIIFSRVGFMLFQIFNDFS